MKKFPPMPLKLACPQTVRDCTCWVTTLLSTNRANRVFLEWYVAESDSREVCIYCMYISIYLFRYCMLQGLVHLHLDLRLQFVLF